MANERSMKWRQTKGQQTKINEIEMNSNERSMKQKQTKGQQNKGKWKWNKGKWKVNETKGNIKVGWRPGGKGICN